MTHLDSDEYMYDPGAQPAQNISKFLVLLFKVTNKELNKQYVPQHMWIYAPPPVSCTGFQFKGYRHYHHCRRLYTIGFHLVMAAVAARKGAAPHSTH
jgi:hypothetical protein